jgi:hypothetical protein
MFLDAGPGGDYHTVARERRSLSANDRDAMIVVEMR